MDRGVGDPLATLHMKSEEIGMHTFADGDEMGHHGNTDLAAEQADDVEKAENVSTALVWTGPQRKQPGGRCRRLNPMKATDWPTPINNSERVVVRSGPRAGVFGVEDCGGGGDATETSRHQESRIKTVQQQYCRNECHEQKRGRGTRSPLGRF